MECIISPNNVTAFHSTHLTETILFPPGDHRFLLNRGIKIVVTEVPYDHPGPSIQTPGFLLVGHRCHPAVFLLFLSFLACPVAKSKNRIDASK